MEDKTQYSISLFITFMPCQWNQWRKKNRIYKDLLNERKKYELKPSTKKKSNSDNAIL